MADRYGRPDDAPDPNDPLLLAARTNDAEIEEAMEHAEDDPEAAFNAYFEKHGLTPNSVMWLAEQRAMRYALIRTGDKAKLDEMHKTNTAKVFKPTDEQRQLMEFVRPVYIDSIIIGWRAHELSVRTPDSR